MTDLSPQAQAVLDASSDAPVGEGWNADRLAIAAALRAAERQLGYELLGVRTIDCSQLLLIADELENQ